MTYQPLQSEDVALKVAVDQHVEELKRIGAEIDAIKKELDLESDAPLVCPLKTGPDDQPCEACQ